MDRTCHLCHLADKVLLTRYKLWVSLLTNCLVLFLNLCHVNYIHSKLSKQGISPKTRNVYSWCKVHHIKYHMSNSSWLLFTYSSNSTKKELKSNKLHGVSMTLPNHFLIHIVVEKLHLGPLIASTCLHCPSGEGLVALICCRGTDSRAGLGEKMTNG